jgi:hypothetical protein
MPSNRIRFEVFKRDTFICQYCGRTPPEVVLEIDHVIPKSADGPDSIDNYVTACFECNRGKGKYTLQSLSPSLQERFSLMKERQAQLKAYNRFLERQEVAQSQAITAIISTFETSFPQSTVTDIFRDATIRRFVALLPVAKVKEAMTLACSTKHNNEGDALRYFCGICWNWIKRPETRNW